MTSKLTRESLRRLREAKRRELMPGPGDARATQVNVGTGTCGIAAGALKTFDAVVQALREKGADDVVVRQTGCMGLCHAEPVVEVRVPGMPAVIYGGVTAEAAREIVERHVVGRQLVDHQICERPAADIMR